MNNHLSQFQVSLTVSRKKWKRLLQAQWK